MPIDEEIGWVRQALILWGASHYREFPWREVEDPWLAMLAEVLLQRTSATHVARYFEEIAVTFPTAGSVAEASDEELALIEGRFGLDRRLATVQAVAEYFLTHKVAAADELVTLYGVGHYTAAAFLSLHMNERAVLVDANVARWLARYAGRERPVDPRHCGWLWELADSLTPSKDFKEYNYAVLDFTMTICRRGTALCELCPIRTSCRSFVESQNSVSKNP